MDPEISTAPEDLKRLAHAGHGAPSAVFSVELTLCDSTPDGTTTEFKLRRTCGSKKDSWYLDDRPKTAQQISSWLESIGISRANPYFIVRQGRVAALATMSDGDRLRLLLDIAGTAVFDGKRRETERHLADALRHRTEAERDLAAVSDRLDALGAELQQLEQFAKLDAQRRAMEFVLRTAERRELGEQVEAAAKAAAEAAQSNAAQEARRTELEAEQIQAQAAHKTSTDAALSARDALAAARAAERDARGRMTAAEIDLEDGERRGEATGSERARLAADVREAAARLDLAQIAVDKARPALEAAMAAADAAQAALEENRATQSRLESQLGLPARCRTERDFVELVGKDRAEADRRLAEVSARLEATRRRVNGSATTAEKAAAELAAAKTGESTLRERIAAAQASQAEFTGAASELLRRQRESFNAKSALQSAADLASRVSLDTMHAVYETAPGRMGQAIEVCRATCQELRLSGIHGTLLECLGCNPKLAAAVEAVAGNQLFHILVDTDDVAAQVLEALEGRSDAGRVTFVPLNRVQASGSHRLPSGLSREEDDARLASASDAFPILSRLQFNEQLRPALEAVFGRTLVCRDIATAVSLSRELQRDCVTLQGDAVYANGPMEGGHRPQTGSSRIELMTRHKDAQEALVAARASLAAATEEASGISAELSRLQAKQRSQKEQLARDLSALRAATASVSRYSSEVDAATKASAAAAAALQLDEREHARLSQEAAELAALLARGWQSRGQMKEQVAAFHAALSDEPSLANAAAETNMARGAAEIELDVAVARLRTLDKALSALRDQLSLLGDAADAVAPLRDALDVARRDYESAAATVAACSDKLAEAETAASEAFDRVSAAEAAFSALGGAVARAELTADDADVALLRVREREASVKAKLRDLGAPPPSELRAEFESLSRDTLINRLGAVAARLSREHAHVNRQAEAQHRHFVERRQQQTEELQQVRAAEARLRGLLAALEKDKRESIEGTLSAVSGHFSEVFSELVPSGSARLVVSRAEPGSPASASPLLSARLAPADADSGSDADAAAAPVLPPLPTGVAPVVSFFNRTLAEDGHNAIAGSRMQELSGGQKSLVALAFIFAIQRADPAPTYVFDEVDAALDDAHRSAVAALIGRMCDAGGRQVLASTFRPELVGVAQEHFLVTSTRKQSHIERTGRVEALTLVERELQESVARLSSAAPTASAEQLVEAAAAEHEAAVMNITRDGKRPRVDMDDLSTGPQDFE
jgi:structural maintenance of chromosome 3 (chondroitin sulfate proteoglycan 6)